MVWAVSEAPNIYLRETKFFSICNAVVVYVWSMIEYILSVAAVAFAACRLSEYVSSPYTTKVNYCFLLVPASDEDVLTDGP